MTTDDNIKHLITTIAGKIRDTYKPERIILFGSYAYGKPNKDSDIDLLIIKTTLDRPIDRRVIVRKIVSGPRRHIPLEFIVLTPGEIQNRLRVGDQFLREIIKNGEVLYAT